MTVRRLAAALLLAAAAPALAYVPATPAALRRAAARRSPQEPTAVEVAGTLELRGAALARLGPLAPAGGGPATAPARILLKVAGRARLELQPTGAAEKDRPAVSVRDERLAGQGGLEATPAAAALVRALAALLAWPASPDGKGLGEALVRRGVRLEETSMGRSGGRIAVVLGGKPGDARALAFFDKESWRPLRLLAAEGATRYDVRLLDWGSPTGGDAFPRAVEVWDGATLLLRFTTARAAANPRLADALF